MLPRVSATSTGDSCPGTPSLSKLTYRAPSAQRRSIVRTFSAGAGLAGGGAAGGGADAQEAKDKARSKIAKDRRVMFPPGESDQGLKNMRGKEEAFHNRAGPPSLPLDLSP